MNFKICIVVFLTALSFTLGAQDTIKIKRAAIDDSKCRLLICAKKACFTDSISINYFLTDTNIELRINDDCKTKNKSDVFVSSFEAAVMAGKQRQSYGAQSSFFTDPQKKIIRKLKPGESFEIKNIVVHAPDGFRRMNDLQLILTK